MQTTTRTSHRNLGDKLAAMRAAAKRQPPNRPRRGTRHPRRRTRPQADLAAVAAAERAIEASPVARNTLETSESLALAKITEHVLAMGLDAVEGTERLIRQQLEAAESQTSIEALHRAQDLRVRLVDPAAETVQWRRKLAAARAEREHLEVELSLWTRGR